MSIRNYSNDFDRRRQGIDQISAKLNSIPDPTAEDEGKILKVSDEGSYELAEDAGTVLPVPGELDEGKVVTVDEGSYVLESPLNVVANPSTESTERLDKLTVGNTTYLVNEDVIPTVLKAVRLKINTIHGSDQNVVMNGLAFKNSINGDSYSYGGSDTITSDIEGSPDLSGLLAQAETYFASSNLPVNLTITFANGLDTTLYNDFCVKCGYYENASPLSVEVLVSADGEHFISVAEVANLTYTRDSYVVIYEFGDVDIKIPDYTSANRGDVLSIDNTDHVVWADVPSELPSHSASDAGKVLSVDNNNEVVWGDVSSKVHTNLLSMNNVNYNSDTNRYSGSMSLKVDGSEISYTNSPVNIDLGAVFAILIHTSNIISLRGTGFSYNVDTTSRTCIERVLQNCAFFNDIDNKMYKIANISGTQTTFSFELVELSA